MSGPFFFKPPLEHRDGLCRDSASRRLAPHMNHTPMLPCPPSSSLLWNPNALAVCSYFRLLLKLFHVVILTAVKPLQLVFMVTLFIASTSIFPNSLRRQHRLTTTRPTHGGSWVPSPRYLPKKEGVTTWRAFGSLMRIEFNRCSMQEMPPNGCVARKLTFSCNSFHLPQKH